jgi:hypothetical protein
MWSLTSAYKHCFLDIADKATAISDKESSLTSSLYDNSTKNTILTAVRTGRSCTSLTSAAMTAVWMTEVIRSSRVRWAGHVAEWPKRNAYRILVEKEDRK